MCCTIQTLQYLILGRSGVSPTERVIVFVIFYSFLFMRISSLYSLHHFIKKESVKLSNKFILAQNAPSESVDFFWFVLIVQFFATRMFTPQN